MKYYYNNHPDKNSYTFIDNNRARRIEYSNKLINNMRPNSNKIIRYGRSPQTNNFYSNYNINYQRNGYLYEKQQDFRNINKDNRDITDNRENRNMNYKTTINYPNYNEYKKENKINDRPYNNINDDNYYNDIYHSPYDTKERERDTNNSRRFIHDYKYFNGYLINNDNKNFNAKTTILKKENNTNLFNRQINNNKLNDNNNKPINNNRLNNNTSKYTNDNPINTKYAFNKIDNNPTFLYQKFYENQKDKQNLGDYKNLLKEKPGSLNAKTEIKRKDDVNSNFNKLLDNKEDKKQTNNNKYNERIRKLNNEYNNSKNNNDKDNTQTNNDKNNRNINDDNNEKNNKLNNSKSKIDNKENRKPEIEVATSQDYLPEAMNTENTTHHKSNKENKSRSVNPYTKVAQTETNQIVNSTMGFNNLGATCYMNSGLQIIIHNKKLMEKLIKFKNSSRLNNISRNNPIITLSFIDLCYSIINNTNNNKNTNYNNYNSKYSKYLNERTYLRNYAMNSLNPSNFKLDFCTKHTSYTRGQHDSIEFLRTLLDDISKEINENQNISAYKELSTKDKSKEEQNLEYHNFFLSREKSIIIDLFYIQMINIFTCKCGFESYSFQKLLDIPLLLPMNKREIDLISLIREYLKEEKIDWSSQCENCKTKNLEHLKKIKISMMNDIVIFSLQRLNPYLSMKSTIFVSYDEIIDLKEFCDFDLYKENTKYRLCGTINHIGNINYGHYYSYVKIGEIWYEFNDSIVRATSSMDFNSSSVCVLFYEKI